MLTSKDFEKFELSEIKNTNQIVGGQDSIQNTHVHTKFLGFLIHTETRCDTVNDD